VCAPRTATSPLPGEGRDFRFTLEPHHAFGVARRLRAELIATSRPSFLSRERYTSATPPAPIGERISCGPSLEPIDKGIR